MSRMRIAALTLFAALAVILFSFLSTKSSHGFVSPQIEKMSTKSVSNGSLSDILVQSPEKDFPMREVQVWTPQVDSLSIDKLPVVYFLHGWPGSPKSMISAVTPVLASEFAAGAEPFIAVFPDGNSKTHIDSEWADSSDKSAMIETWLTKNVITAVEGDNPRPREKRAIVGFSMGGYGASIIALHHPDLYGQVVSLAGYFLVDDLTGAFSGNAKNSFQNPSDFLSAANQMRWYLAEATDDFSIPIRGEMVRWSSLLKKLHIPVTTDAPKGGHTFTFVSAEISQVSKWFTWPN